MATTTEFYGAQSQPGAITRIARALYLASTALFLGAVLLQVFFAGAALLVDPEYLNQHRAFAHVMELVTFIIALVSLFARLPRRVLLLSWLPLLLVILQYVFLYALAPLGVPPSLRALHAVNALIIFGVTVRLTQHAWRLLREQ